MRLKDIQYFIALTEEKSFTRAAEKYHVSQPTISYAIKHLENDLKAQLIIRDQSHKRMALTQTAKYFISTQNQPCQNWERRRKRFPA